MGHDDHDVHDDHDIFKGFVVVVFLVVVVVALGAARPAARQDVAPAASSAPSANRALLDKYCVTCHNDRLRTGGLSLAQADTERPIASTEVWEKVIRKLRTGAMPPSGMPRPDEAALDGFVTYLETSIDRAAAARPSPGRPAVRRLNRTEYSNAIRDLVAVEIDAGALLPADDSRYGFDNVGDVLTLSPLLAERYLAVARHVRRLALGDAVIRPAIEQYTVSKNLMQDDRASEDLPFGSRGGLAVQHHFPASGEYVFKVRLQQNSRQYIRGMQQPNELDVRLDGRRLQHFTVGGERRGKSAFVFSSATMGEVAQEQYERTADEVLDVRQWVEAGAHRVSASFFDDRSVPERPLQQRLTMYDYSQFKGGQAGVATLTIDGPYNVKGPGDSESRRRIFVCRPASAAVDDPCATRILTTLARRAYRRPVTDEDLRPLMTFYTRGRADGFEAGIGLALERLLAGPEFLFRIERSNADPKGSAPQATSGASPVGLARVDRVGDYDLASRLSFFLWSSIPDEALLDLAERGRLNDPAVLEQQVRRMLADGRASALVTSFAAQWLHLRNMASVTPDQEQFPYFDDNLRAAFRTETELFFDSVLREDRSVLDLLNADYTFVNERLAAHYGIPGVYGSHFRRVRVPDGSRGGLLGQGSILTVTSYSNRTSPVIRGKWVLENILSTPPSPPPPGVPALQERDGGGKVLSMRAQMEQHRANPACATCHRLMDPIGFALENFDGVGRWRTTDAKTPIDASGVMPDGTKFSGVSELRRVLQQKQRDQFVWTVADRLLTYALGRGVDYTDAPALRAIIRDAAPGNYKLSSLVLGVAKSMPFQMKTSIRN
jgi:mono/diheme cytochrome c family protein